MRPGLVIIIPPSCKAVPGVSQGQKNMLIQAFVAHFTIETFDVPVVHRLPRTYKIQPDLVLMRPGIQFFAGKLRTIVHPNAFGEPPLQT